MSKEKNCLNVLIKMEATIKWYHMVVMNSRNWIGCCKLLNNVFFLITQSRQKFKAYKLMDIAGEKQIVTENN